MHRAAARTSNSSGYYELNYRTFYDVLTLFLWRSRLQQYCVLNQILEFHGIVQSQMEKLVALEKFLGAQHQDFMDDQPSNEDVEVHVEIVQRTFQCLGRICQELRNAANVLRLPSRRRFPFCSHVDHVRYY